MAEIIKNNLIVKYDSAVDALSLVLNEGEEVHFEELAPGLGVEFDKQGQVIGFEILKASRYLKDTLPSLNKKAKELVLDRV